jgi:two-component system OmpR family response regulator
MPKILMIEDDPLVGQDIQDALKDVRCELEWVATGMAGIARAVDPELDLIVLDRVLPGVDGLTIVKTLRSANVATPVLMVSALSNVDERVRGLMAGGDDYVAKPFSPDELRARVLALLRRKIRAQDASAATIDVDDLSIDFVARKVKRGTSAIDLTPVAFRLLECLARNSRQILTRAMIYETVWNMHFDPCTNLVEVHIGQLRKKIDLPGYRPLIRTVRGSGYVLG